MSETLDISIDENNLMGEWKRQASMMLDYGIQLADAMQEEDEAKNDLAVVDAELDRGIRENPSAYGVSKITESTVANAILEQLAHIKGNETLSEARHRARILKVTVDAIHHRKSSLQGMTDLFMRQWFADPASPEQPGELRDAAKAGPPTKVIPGRVRRTGAEN